jgi:trimeric autotransporter adhesin
MKHVTFHLPSFLRRVRIHGGEFDSSARAMNREKQVRLLQADLRIVRGSTIERKQMSTTIKRVALVAVAALGLGVLSVAPSQAVSQADTLSISATTAAIQTGETATATLTGTFLSDSVAGGDTLTVTSSATSLPAGGNVMPTLVASDTVNAVVSISGNVARIVNVAGAVTATSGKITVNVVMPANAKVGTYAYRFTPSVATGSTLNSAAVTFTVTVTASPADDVVASAAKSTSIIQTGETVTAGSIADSATVVAKTVVATAQAATIRVVVKNANGNTLATQPALTVLVKSGTPGTVGAGADNNDSATAMVSTGRALTTTAGQIIGVFADGTEGVAEVEIYAGTTLLATEKVTFFGDVASYAGTFAVKSLGVGDTSTITVTGADKAANKTAAPAVYAVSSDSSVATVPATQGAAGSIVVTGVKSGKATITLCDTAACASAKITSTVAITVGAKTAKTVTLSMSPAAPTAGEKVTVTLTATDASGNPVADGVRSLFAAGGFSPSVTVNGSTLPTVETTTISAGVAEYIFYAPSAGAVTFTATEGTATDSTTKGKIEGTVTVSNPGLDAATDAANEAIDAANAATDAALAAAEAADAATTAAQEASDAVAALSESVTKLIAGLQAQIKSLAAVVAKIAKKVKA